MYMNYEKFKRSDRPDRFRNLTLLQWRIQGGASPPRRINQAQILTYAFQG
jgi:hypothetical protein